MNREERFLDWGSFLLVVLGFFYTILHDSGLIPQVLEPYPYSVIITLTLFVIGIIGIIGMAFVIRRKHTIKTTIGNPIFSNLVIHLSHKDDTPDTPHPSNPRFVSYKTEAYWINDEIELHFRQHEIARWYSYDGERKLRKSLGAQGIHINDKDFPSIEALGLWRKPDGSLMPAQELYDSNTLLKLQERKDTGELKKYQLAFIHPWHRFRVKWRNRNFPPDTVLLLNHDTHIACPPPTGYMKLWYDGIVNCQIYRKWLPSEWLRLWSTLYGFTFSREPCDISELSGVQKQQ